MLALIRLAWRTQAVLASAGCRVAHVSRVLAKPSRFRGLLKIVSARRVRYRQPALPEFNPRVSLCNVVTLLANHEPSLGGANKDRHPEQSGIGILPMNSSKHQLEADAMPIPLRYL